MANKSGFDSGSADDIEYLAEEMTKVRKTNAVFEEEIERLKQEITSLNKNVEYVDETLKDLYAKFGGDANTLPDNVWARMKAIFEYFGDRV